MIVLDLPTVKRTPFTHVDCGARNSDGSDALRTAFPLLRTIGFEPDAEECERLNAQFDESRRFFPVCVAGDEGSRTLHITTNRSCCSLLRPNTEFWSSFQEGSSFEIESTQGVSTVALDAYLPAMGVTEVDSLKVDVQGADLEVLRGARGFLETTVMGVEVEVEFSPMYVGQPLFADVDQFLRALGFVMFDVSRARYYRRSLPRPIGTRAQLIWGDALYLRNYRPLLEEGNAQSCLKLAVLASAHGFHDYAAEILDSVVASGLVAGGLLDEVVRARESYVSDLVRGPAIEPARSLSGHIVRTALQNSAVRRTAAYVLHALQEIDSRVPLRPLPERTHVID